MKKPIIDIHCDLLVYLTRPESSPNNDADIGCAIPYLKEGHVKLQVMAIFTPTKPSSHQSGMQQSVIFSELDKNNDDLYAVKPHHLDSLVTSSQVGMLAAIENASAFCDENMTLKQGFDNLELIISHVGRLFYVSFTHHSENRFGGGNYTDVGLKKDGKALIDYLDGKHIPIDLSHTSDKLAYDMLEYISQQNRDIPIIASHSNYRRVFNHPRNLPDDIAKEIFYKKGLVGVNFLRAFVNEDDPKALYEHISYGITLEGKDSICYGADYFYCKDHPDKSRFPFYFSEYANASCYQTVSQALERQFDKDFSDKISYKNVIQFLNRLWA